MSTTQTTPIEPSNRIQLPADWGPRLTWDDIFATKLTIRSAPADDDENEWELTRDDLLF